MKTKKWGRFRPGGVRSPHVEESRLIETIPQKFTYVNNTTKI